MSRKRKTLPVLKNTIPVYYVYGLHHQKVLRQLQTSTDDERFSVKSSASNPFVMDLISRSEEKSPSEKEVFKMSRVTNVMSEMVMKDDSFLSVFNQFMRYVVAYAS